MYSTSSLAVQCSFERLTWTTWKWSPIICKQESAGSVLDTSDQCHCWYCCIVLAGVVRNMNSTNVHLLQRYVTGLFSEHLGVWAFSLYSGLMNHSCPCIYTFIIVLQSDTEKLQIITYLFLENIDSPSVSHVSGSKPFVSMSPFYQ